MLSKLFLSQWLANDFLQYLKEWVEESKHGPGTPKENQRACLSKETILGLRITGM